MKVEMKYIGNKTEMRKMKSKAVSKQKKLSKLLSFIAKNPIHLPENYKFNRDEIYE